jgi:hypothetical protein
MSYFVRGVYYLEFSFHDIQISYQIVIELQLNNFDDLILILILFWGELNMFVGFKFRLKHTYENVEKKAQSSPESKNNNLTKK